jgi:hypothetical protein
MQLFDCSINSSALITGYIMRQLIGLRTFLYTFKTAVACESTRRRLSDKGVIITVFINNGYGFELKLNRRVY